MIVAIAANFVFGILLNFGVGNYRADARDVEPDGAWTRARFPIMAAGRGA